MAASGESPFPQAKSVCTACDKSTGGHISEALSSRAQFNRAGAYIRRVKALPSPKLNFEWKKEEVRSRSVIRRPSAIR